MSDIELLEAPVEAVAVARVRQRRPVRQRGSVRPMPAGPVIPAVRARLVSIAGQAATPRAMAALDEDDALRPARGIVLGLLMVTPFWVAMGSLWALLG